MNEQKTQACSLADRECLPCKGGVPPLKGEELAKFAAQLDDGWQIDGLTETDFVFAAKTDSLLESSS